jgi:hypothetical protein
MTAGVVLGLLLLATILACAIAACDGTERGPAWEGC